MADRIAPCEHEAIAVTFDKEAARDLSTTEIRERWPRFLGNCPTCGERLIKYASYEHYLYGDW